MVGLAEIGIDLQYFLIEDDIVGDLLIRELMIAAERGVRVRILLDDIGTEGYELAFAVLTANPNIEIRLTNPFAHREVRAAEVTDFQRINHRMHNKSITFDNAVSIVGGRNMGAPYFGAAAENAETTPYVDALDNEIVDFVLGSDTDVLIWSQAHVAYDLPYGEKTADGIDALEGQL